MSIEDSARTGATRQQSAELPVPEQLIRILHVNDSTDDQVLFQAACRMAKVPLNWHVTDSAAKGISYLRTLLEQSSKDVPVCWPAVVLLDVAMPEESGLQVLRFIRATPALKHLPVIIFSAYERAKEESLALGANAFWVKPLELLETVELAKRLYALVREFGWGR